MFQEEWLVNLYSPKIIKYSIAISRINSQNPLGWIVAGLQNG